MQNVGDLLLKVKSIFLYRLRTERYPKSGVEPIQFLFAVRHEFCHGASCRRPFLSRIQIPPMS